MYLENLSCVAYKSSLSAEVLIYKVICHLLSILKRGAGLIFSLYFIISATCTSLLIEARPLYPTVSLWIRFFCEKWTVQMTRVWDEEKIWVLNGKRTHDLPHTGQSLCLLSYENLTEFILHAVSKGSFHLLNRDCFGSFAGIEDPQDTRIYALCCIYCLSTNWYSCGDS